MYKKAIKKLGFVEKSQQRTENMFRENGIVCLELLNATNGLWEGLRLLFIVE